MSRRLGQVGLVVLYSFVLLLVLRFCGRTYPGWYFPNSRFLNGLLNDNILFIEIGYGLVAVGAAAATARIFMWSDSHERTRLRRRLVVVQVAAVVIVAAIIGYGIWWADAMQRLPWQPDAIESDYVLGAAVPLVGGSRFVTFSR